jgi:multiple sugar transport system substrate-binding protein
MGQYRPAAVQQVTVDGKVYGIPEFYSVRVMMTSNQAVKEAGLSPSDVDTTDWSKLPGLAEKLTRHQGRQAPADRLRPQDPRVPAHVGQGQRRRPAQRRRQDRQLNDPRWSRP